MASEDAVSTSRRKGKSRAVNNDISETTPLLGSSSTYLNEDTEIVTPTSRRTRLYTLLGTIFLSTLSICIIALIIIAFLAYSYKSRISIITPEDVITKALVLRGPNRLDVLNVTEGQIWLQVDGEVGVDVGELIGVNPEEEDWYFRRMWKWWGRWGVQRLESVTVETTIVQLSSQGHTLGTIQLPEINLPLTVDPSADYSWLTPISLPLLLRPTLNSTSLSQIFKDSWRNGAFELEVHIGEVFVHGGQQNELGWKRIVEVVKRNVVADIRVKIPHLPGLPQPGGGKTFPDIKDLLSIHSFDVITNQTVQINVEAILHNPLPDNLTFSIDIPSVPVQVLFPRALTVDDELLVPIISAENQPITLSTLERNISIPITGTLLPIAPLTIPLLSRFISTYLRGASNRVVLGTPILPSFSFDYEFPGPSPRPQVLRNVTIRNMKIKASSDGMDMLASGMVYARVVLPKGFNVDINVIKIWPDVLVFDGEVPFDITSGMYIFPSEKLAPQRRRKHDKDKDDDRPPLPEPLPERAFARIRPDDWLDAISAPIAPSNRSSDEGSEYDVTAMVVDVPLEVLPEREGEFRKFIGKVIFGSEGALTGVQGVTAVAASIKGLNIPTTDEDIPNRNDGEEDNGYGPVIQLSDLPVKGLFRVGKKAF